MTLMITAGGCVKIKQEFGMRPIQRRFITGHGVGGGALSVPMTAAQWCVEARLPGYENMWFADRAS